MEPQARIELLRGPSVTGLGCMRPCYNTDMTQKETVAHWRKRSQAEWKTAKNLFEMHDPDVHAEVLFHCHLAIELALKAQYISQKNDAAPLTHSLSDIASYLRESWLEDEQDALDQLSEYAILARYGDDKWFIKHATKQNAALWLEKTRQLLSKISHEKI